MNSPRPTALRLHTRAGDVRRATIPFGLNEWSDGASDVAVLLETATEDSAGLPEIAAQIPDAATLPTEATVVVLGGAVRSTTSWRRWLGDRTVRVPRALRCTALLVRGYVDIGATAGDGGDDLAWGRVGPR